MDRLTRSCWFAKRHEFTFEFDERTDWIPASQADISDFEEFWEVKVPADLKAFWEERGGFAGFTSKNTSSAYLSIEPPRAVVASFGKVTKEFMPKGFAAFGTNGGGEMLVFQRGRGFGLLSSIHGGAEDYIFISEGFDEFLSKAAKGSFFE